MPSNAGRRDLLNWLLGICGGGVVGSVAYPVARYLTPPDGPEDSMQLGNPGSGRALPPNSGRIVPFGSQPVLLIRTSSGALRAFSATCTHLACTVQYPPDPARILCA